MKYLSLILLPSSLAQWLLLAACAVGGWLLLSHCMDTKPDSLTKVNIIGAACGIALFYGLKNCLGGAWDALTMLSGGCVEGYPPHSIAGVFMTVPRFLVGFFCMSVVYGAYKPFSDAKDEEYRKEREQKEQEKKADETRQSTQQAFDAFATQYGIVRAEPGQPNYHGYMLVDDDNGGNPDPLWNAMTPDAVQRARGEYRLYGEPGGGLSQSDFSKGEIQSGMKGEQVLASMVSANCPNTVSFWSLHGLDERQRKTSADIDCIIAGQDRNGITRLWFVDAKNYKGNADTAYRNIAPNQLERICISRRAFEKGVDGRPDLEISSNMDWQRANWASLMDGKPVVAEWLVCMVPVTGKGVPNVDGVTWPGDIPCVTPEELVRRVNAADLDSMQNIPLEWLNLLKRQLKR